MDSRRLLSLIDELADLEIFDITFAGGEPLLHPDALDFVSRALENGLHTALLTNGVELHGQTRRDLAELVRGRPFILQVSLDSYDSRINDLTRGKGTCVIENIRKTAELGVPVQLACVITDMNISSAYMLIDTFYPLVKRFHFLNLQRTASSLMHPELFPTRDAVKSFWCALKAHAERFPPDLFLPSLRIMLRMQDDPSLKDEAAFNRRATLSCRSCSAGLTHINVSAAFDVLGCDIAKDFTLMGNVANCSFAAVWNGPEAAAVRSLPYPACHLIGPVTSTLPAGGI